ncbi:MAG: aminotransferase class IV [Phycisphaerae bacterium]
MAESTYIVDGKSLPAHAAVVDVHDLQFARGYGAFEALRTYGGKPMRLRPHLQRLARTLRLLELRLAPGLALLEREVRRGLAENNFPESLIKIYITGGSSHFLTPTQQPRRIIMIEPLPSFPPRQYTHGIKLWPTDLQRVIPLAKSTSYLAGVVATIRALRQGYDEVVFVNPRGALLEGSTFNVFAICGRKLISPRQGILAGITAGDVLRLAKRFGLTPLYAPITPAQVAGAEEMFITSSNREVIPVVRVGKTKIGTGRPGPQTQALHAAYQPLARRVAR